MSVIHTRNIYKNSLVCDKRKDVVATQIAELVDYINLKASRGCEYITYDLNGSNLLDCDLVELEKLGYTWEYVTHTVVRIGGWTDV